MSSTWMGPSYLIQAARDGNYDTQKSLKSSVLRKRQDDMGLTTGSVPSRSLMLLDKNANLPADDKHSLRLVFPPLQCPLLRPRHHSVSD